MRAQNKNKLLKARENAPTRTRLVILWLRRWCEFFGPIAERSKAKPNQTNEIPDNLPRSKCSKYRALVNGTCQGILFEVESKLKPFAVI